MKFLITLINKTRRLLQGLMVAILLLITGISTLYGLNGNMQEKVVHGRVSSFTTGETLVGVTVAEVGTTNGTFTDVKGDFTLVVAGPEARLRFSYVGFLSETVVVGGQNTINIVLVEDIVAMSEVVVVGYGVQKKSDITGSIAQVNADQIQNIAAPQIASALQGKAAGVFVSNRSGKAGGDVDIRIRGITSLNNVAPLWIIDGMPGDPNLVNMNDIENVDIIKDGTAAAIYGVKAAAGVILVTTKRGVGQKKPKISFNTYTGVSEPWRLPQLVNSDEYIILKNEQWANDGVPVGFSLDSLGRYPTTNWMREMFTTGKSQNYDLNVSGSNETTNYYIGFTHFNEEPSFIDNSYKRYSIRINSDYNITDWLKVGESMTFLASQLNPVNDEGRYMDDLFRTPPMMPVFDENNQPGGYGYVDYESLGKYDGGNPYATQMTSVGIRNHQKIGGNAYATARIIPSLSITATFGGNFSFNNNRTVTLPYKLADKKDFASTNVNLDFNRGWDILGNIYANYTKSFGAHDINLTAGYEASQREGSSLYGQGIDASFGLHVLDRTQVIGRSTGGNEWLGRSISQFGRATYTFSDKYIIQGIVRRDGSDKFGKDNQYGIFPSVSAAWKLSEEEFIKNIDLISFLKLRGGYGINGNDNIDQFLYSAYMVSGKGYPYGFYSNVQPYQSMRTSHKMFNPNIRWEQSKQIDIGMELGMFNNQLFLTTEVYQKSTSHMLLNNLLPLSVGLGDGHTPASYPVQVVNAGQISNRGIDVSTTYKGVIGQLKYSLSANASAFRYVVDQLTDGQPMMGNNVLGANPVSRTIAGEPGGFFYGYQVVGIFQTQAQVDEYNNRARELAKQQNPDISESALADIFYQFPGTAPGDLIFKDITGNGRVTADDRGKIGNPWPKAIYGFQIMASYKWFDLLVNASGVYKADVFNEGRIRTHQFKSYDYSTSIAALERWTEDNPSQTNYRITGNDPNKNMSLPSSWYIEDGSYLRLNNVQLGFTLPSTLSNRFQVDRFRVYISGQNLLTITNYSGFDPEFGIGSATGAGVDRGTYPQSRVFLFGLQLDI